MHDNVSIIRARQLGIRRQIDKRGIALKLVAADSGIPYETLLTYFPQEGSREPAQIPGGAIYALCDGKALPADLLSLMLPDGWQIVRVPEAIDHDEICEWAEGFIAAKTKAHRADSPMGVEIAPCERDELNGKVSASPLRLVA